MLGTDVVTEDAAHPTARRGVAGVADTALDATVVLLATWTLVYHVSLVAGVPSSVAVVVEAVLLVAAGVAWQRLRMPAPPAEGSADDVPAPVVRSRALLVTVVAALVAALAMTFDLWWFLVWVPWLVAGVAGTVAAKDRLRERVPSAAPAPSYDGGVALAWAAGLAVFSTFTLRPNPDDLYYVNLSQWVAEHGSFPVRDTIFSNLGFPMSSFPPMASYDGLTGAIAHVLGISAGDVVYVVVPPVATFLSVLALWRLLRAWRVRGVAIALSAALLFLMFDGTSAYGPPGNLFTTRLWQGKVILLCLLVPTLLVLALRHAERPSRRGLVWLAMAGIAAVGLSTTAIFLVPVIAIAAAAPVLATSRRHAVQAFVAMAAYPLAAGVVTKALGGRSADDFAERRLYRFEPHWFGHAVFLTGVLALVAVLAVLVAALLVPHPAARVTSALMVVAVGVTFVPGVTHLGYDTVGLGPTLWRISWGLTIGAAVGVGATWLLARLRPRLRAVGALAGVGVLVVGGAPVWSPDTSTALLAPFHWQRGDATRSVVQWIVENTQPGDVVLGPDQLAITVAVTTTDIKTVAPRDYFLSYLRDDPAFHYDDRLGLVHLVNDVDVPAGFDATGALRQLDVAVACVYRADAGTAARVAGAGYALGLRTTTYSCFIRD